MNHSDHPHRRSSARALRRITFAGTILFAAWRLSILTPYFERGFTLSAIVAGLQALIETAAAFYLISSVIKALAYSKLVRRGSAGAKLSERTPPVALLYLTCDDIDMEALESLTRVRYKGPLTLVIHDDSTSAAGKAAVDRAVEKIKERWDHPLVLLRRPQKQGGKPGVLNWVIARTFFLHHFLVICDNDSLALDPDFIPRALTQFDDPNVAAVQFRNVGQVDPGQGRIHHLLARAVDSFDVFVRYYALSGMMPFLGHNAMLRTDALQQVGGFREGVLSDDIDLTVRLAMEGKRVFYEPRIEFGERHPGSYGSFRRRCQKWSYGCMQVLRRHLLPALRSPKLDGAAKLWLLEFSFFYVLQSCLVLYLFLSYVAAPLLGIEAPSGLLGTGLAGLVVVGAIMAPTLAYFLAWDEPEKWAEAAWCCALVYGGSAFATARGTLEYLTGRQKAWIPTNQKRSERMLPVAILAETLFGVLLLGVPLVYQPDLMLAPAYVFFVAVFLFAPVVHLTYRARGEGTGARFLRASGLAPSPSPDGGGKRGGRRMPLRLSWAKLGVVLLVPMLGGLTIHAVEQPKPGTPRVAVKGDAIYVDGQPFQVRGIHYSPWLPGTGPGGKYPWPSEKTVSKDFDLLRSLNVNTLLLRDAPRSVLDRATRENMMVIYAFTLNWQSMLDDDAFDKRLAAVTADVKRLEDEPSLLMWSLGNEIPQWLYEQHEDLLEKRLFDLYKAVKAVDPNHPITHQNWPITKDLKVPFLDVVSFNLYPAWPREVVVRGYGDYLRQVLKPLAAGRPLVITEFGMNTLESSPARQAATLRKCWNEIRKSTAGGVVFEFSDEWWKNWDNPISPPDWWHRKFAPHDETSHDLDPEEYYGIYTSERVPKPAAQVVRQMFGPSRLSISEAWFLTPLVLLLGYTFYVIRRKL